MVTQHSREPTLTFSKCRGRCLSKGNQCGTSSSSLLPLLATFNKLNILPRGGFARERERKREKDRERERDREGKSEREGKE